MEKYFLHPEIGEWMIFSRTIAQVFRGSVCDPWAVGSQQWAVGSGQ